MVVFANCTTYPDLPQRQFVGTVRFLHENSCTVTIPRLVIGLLSLRPLCAVGLERMTRLELATTCLEGRNSSHLSYIRIWQGP